MVPGGSVAGGASGTTETVACETEIAENWLGILYAKVFSRQPDRNAIWHQRAFDGGDSIDEIYKTLNDSCEAKGDCSSFDDNCKRVTNPSVTAVCDEPVCKNSYYSWGLEYMIEQGALNAGCPVTEMSEEAIEEVFLPDASSCSWDCSLFNSPDCKPSCKMPGGSKSYVGGHTDQCNEGSWFPPAIECASWVKHWFENDRYKCYYKWTLTGGYKDKECKTK